MTIIVNNLLLVTIISDKSWNNRVTDSQHTLSLTIDRLSQELLTERPIIITLNCERIRLRLRHQELKNPGPRNQIELTNMSIMNLGPWKVDSLMIRKIVLKFNAPMISTGKSRIQNQKTTSIESSHHTKLRTPYFPTVQCSANTVCQFVTCQLSLVHSVLSQVGSDQLS